MLPYISFVPVLVINASDCSAARERELERRPRVSERSKRGAESHDSASIVCKSKCNLPVPLLGPVTTCNGRETLGDPRRSNFEIDTTASHNGRAVTGVPNRDRYIFYFLRPRADRVPFLESIPTLPEAFAESSRLRDVLLSLLSFNTVTVIFHRGLFRSTESNLLHTINRTKFYST